jgi:hypothetical protein
MFNNVPWHGFNSFGPGDSIEFSTFGGKGRGRSSGGWRQCELNPEVERDVLNSYLQHPFQNISTVPQNGDDRIVARGQGVLPAPAFLVQITSADTQTNIGRLHQILEDSLDGGLDQTVFDIFTC